MGSAVTRRVECRCYWARDSEASEQRHEQAPALSSNAAVADFDGENYVSNIVATSYSKQGGRGAAEQRRSVRICDGPHGVFSLRRSLVAAQDVNADDKADIVTANTDGSVSMLLNNGDGGSGSMADDDARIQLKFRRRELGSG